MICYIPLSCFSLFFFFPGRYFTCSCGARHCMNPQDVLQPLFASLLHASEAPGDRARATIPHTYPNVSSMRQTRSDSIDETFHTAATTRERDEVHSQQVARCSRLEVARTSRSVACGVLCSDTCTEHLVEADTRAGSWEREQEVNIDLICSIEYCLSIGGS